MEKCKKYLKIPLILLGVCLLLELLLFGYKVVINKGFDALHLTGNTKIEISKEEIKIDENSDKNYNYLIVNKNFDSVYNVSLKLKKENEDMYIRVVGNVDQVMQKSNKEQDTFKAYFGKNGVTLKEIQIAYPKGQIDIENIDSIVINDNLDYVAEPSFSIKEFGILFGIAIAIYIFIKIIQYIHNTNIKLKVEYVFLIIALLFGSILTFVSAPLAKYDEHAHFWRTYEIASGHIISNMSNELPTSVSRMIIDENGQFHINDIDYKSTQEKLEMDLNPEDTTPLAVGATASNSPLSYIPQLIGTIIGKMLNLNPVIIVYLGRLANLIAFTALIYISIKLMPKKKWKQLIAIIGIFPMTLNIAASYSPDATIIAVAIFMLSYVLHIKYEREKVGIKEGIVLGITSMILAICKIVYFPMLLLFFLIPKEKFANKKARILSFTVMLIILIGGNLLWKSLPQNPGEIAIRTSGTEQLYYAMSNPMRDLGILSKTLIELTPQYLVEMTGGWNTPNIISIIFLIMFIVMMLIKDEDEKKLEKNDKIILGLICLLELFLIFVGFYVTWTRAHWEIIEGIQGRYLLPILPLIAVLGSVRKIDIKIKNIEWKELLTIIILYVPVIVTTIQTFM